MILINFIDTYFTFAFGEHMEIWKYERHSIHCA